MRIKHIKINNFRGIREMSWSITSPVTCLIGPGDSTKTTILDAIELSLLPRWNYQFDDSDFYMSNVKNPIEIIVTLGQIPGTLLSEQKFGLYIRGWTKAGEIRDEPAEDDEPVLSIRLKVDDSLEPEWTVTNDRNIEGKKISYKEREALGANRLGSNIEKHLSWGRGSSLTHMTENNREVKSVLIDASRKIKNEIDFDKFDELLKTAHKTQNLASGLGVKPNSGYTPQLDSNTISTNFGAISIYDGKIPLRLMGLGTQKLIALSLQLSLLRQGEMILIDEVEHALEPFRIRHLLRTINDHIKSSIDSIGQVIMTSHSHTAIVELEAEKLCVVRSENGMTTCINVNNELQSTIRDVPESLLGRKIIVCEGKTEFGLLISLEEYWKNSGMDNFASKGVVPVEGGGDTAPKRTIELSELGYNTCLFLDSDKLNELKPDIETIKSSGVELIHWAGEVSTEQRIILDIPWAAVKKVVELAVEFKGQDSVFDSIRANLGINSKTNQDIDEFKNHGFSEEEIRCAIGRAAKKNNWFKRIDPGKRLGYVLVEEFDDIAGKEIMETISTLKNWIYE
ncbi:MAG: AAA family ATPase [Candidatus Aminicenantes bacterium]|nr:AAA family ATPase [Candidatus Aminicenantes bacterium]